MTHSVLMVLSAADHWTLKDGTQHPTGFWAEEFLTPYEMFTGAGWSVTIATPGGVAPTVDQKSLGFAGGLPQKRAAMKAKLRELKPLLDSPNALESIDPDLFDVVFYPGGHGPMEDLAVNATSGAIIAKRMSEGRVLAMLCHAPAAALAASTPGETSPFSGKSMTGLSNVEETLNGLAKKAPWLLETRLKELGARYSKAPLPFTPKVVVDGNLFTGQNPQSSKKLAQAVIDAVR